MQIKSVYSDCVGIKWTRAYKQYGYVLQCEVVSGAAHECKDIEITSAYTLDGDYIGNARNANFLCRKMGIKPECSSKKHHVCSIGRGKDGKWYGWSHRAICGFKVGDKLFEERFGDDKTPFIKHGRKTIKNLKEARLAASRFAESVS